MRHFKILFVLCSLSFFACDAPPSANASAQTPTTIPTPKAAPPPPPKTNPTPTIFSLSDVAEKSVESVVNIATLKFSKTRQSPMRNDPLFRHFFGRGQKVPPQKEQSLGSGVVVTSDGVVLTNNHVIEGADEVRVSFADGREYRADIVGTDPQSDLGVLRIKASDDELKKIRPIKMGNSKEMRLGEVVLAVGNPFGVGQTVTMGIVSAKGRASVGIAQYENFIQTDAAINPGNSGGALVNTEGELIGINTAILSRSGGYQGIGFAIPTEMANPLMQSLLAHGRVIRGYLGVGIQDVDERTMRALNLPSTKGVVISEVGPNTPAERAGLEPGDVVTFVDDKAVEDATALRNTIADKGADVSVVLSIIRLGKTQKLTVQLAQKPGARRAQGTLQGDKRVALGLRVVELTKDNRDAFGVDDAIAAGALVTQIDSQGRAAQVNIKVGDVIIGVGKDKISSADELQERVRKMSGAPIALRVARGSSRLFVIVD